MMDHGAAEIASFLPSQISLWEGSWYVVLYLVCVLVSEGVHVSGPGMLKWPQCFRLGMLILESVYWQSFLLKTCIILPKTCQYINAASTCYSRWLPFFAYVLCILTGV